MDCCAPPATGVSVATGAGMAALDCLQSEWAALAAQQHGALGWFMHPDWVRAHVLALEDPSRLRVLTVRVGGELAAVLPLICATTWFRGLPVRCWRAAAGGHSLRFDLLLTADHSGRAAAAHLARYLATCGGWDVIELRDVPRQGAAAALLDHMAARGCRVGRWEAMQSPCCDLRSPQAPALRPAFRTELRRTHRRLQATAPSARLRLLQASIAPDDLMASLSRFYALEAAGWKGRQHSAIACQPRVRRFYDLAATALAARGALVLHQLDWCGRALAMSYGLMCESRFDVIKWAYDETFSHFGPGHLLIEAMIRECPGLREFHFNGPDAPYKRKWTQVREPLDFLYFFAPTALGTLCHSLKFCWTPRLQHWLGKT